MEEKRSKPPRRGPVDARIGQDRLFSLPEVERGSQGGQAEDVGPQGRPHRREYPKLDDRAPFACVILDEGGMIWEANLAAAALLHAERELLPGTSLSSFVAPHCLNDVLAHLKRITGKGKADRCEVELETDGLRRAVRLDSLPFASGGRLAGIYSAILDITVQKRTEALLHESEKRLALIVEQSAEMILMTDRDGVVQYANNAFLESSGKKKAEVIGVPVRDCGASGDKDFYERLQLRLQRERKWNGRMTLKRPDGRFYELDVAVSPVREASGVLLNYVIVCRDVTMEAVLGRQLRQVQKMEAIQTLAGGVAHDFNNLLAAIMGNVELAMDDVPAESSVCHNLEQIFKASRRGKDLVKQILVFSRRDQQESVLVEAGPLITETMKLLRSSIPAGIDVRHHVEPGRSTVLADAGRLQQILMNLVSNAVHAMREKGGVLDVAVREYQLTESSASLPDLKPGPYLMISVSDSGHGMSQSVMERIFEPFFTTKRPGEGPGMGLAVVHGIVKALKGAVTVESDLGKGSTFAVYLPIAVSATERTVKEESRPLPRHHRPGHARRDGHRAGGANKVRPQQHPHHHNYRLQRDDRRRGCKEDGHPAVPHEAPHTAGALAEAIRNVLDRPQAGR